MSQLLWGSSGIPLQQLQLYHMADLLHAGASIQNDWVSEKLWLTQGCGTDQRNSTKRMGQVSNPFIQSLFTSNETRASLLISSRAKALLRTLVFILHVSSWQHLTASLIRVTCWQPEEPACACVAFQTASL